MGAHPADRVHRAPRGRLGNLTGHEGNVEVMGTGATRASQAATWQPSLGAWVEDDGTRFRVWGPAARSVALVTGDRDGERRPMNRHEDGYWELHVPGVRAGDRYWYCLDGDRTLPDPASRFQPDGVHGPSQVIDPRRFVWTDAGWTGSSLQNLILYE